MNFPVAQNQSIMSKENVESEILTDPIPVVDFNYIDVMFFAHYVFTTATTPSLTFTVQVSNDGLQWTDTTITATVSTASVDPSHETGDLTTGLMRFSFKLAASGGTGGEVSAACFDAHVRLLNK